VTVKKHIILDNQQLRPDEGKVQRLNDSSGSSGK